MDSGPHRPLALAPYGPFRVLAEGEQPDRKPVLPGVRGELVPIYHAGARLGFTPRDLDEMELWEVAAVFGVGLDGPDDGALPDGVGDMRRGWIDPNVLQRARRRMGREAPDIELGSYHPDLGVLS